MYGPPVKPPQPRMGFSAAFGGGIDWQTSTGEDRYRRGLYTSGGASNPYPSMATFDAPNREVCTVRRDRTNTPLQALVTLNDPVYVEAAQALARRMHGTDWTIDRAGRLRLPPRACAAASRPRRNWQRLTELYDRVAREQFAPIAAQGRTSWRPNRSVPSPSRSRSRRAGRVDGGRQRVA